VQMGQQGGVGQGQESEEEHVGSTHASILTKENSIS
jgi:hypothetical protein